MKHSKKMTLATMVLSSVILTGCFFQDVPSSEGNNSSSSSPTKNLSSKEIKEIEAKIDEKYKPTEAPKIEMDESQKPPEKLTADQEKELEEIKEGMSSAPLGMDISKIEIPKDVSDTFPEADFNVKEGVRFALETYQSITHQSNLFAPRDTSKDWEYFGKPYSSKMMSYFAADFEKNMKNRDDSRKNDNFLYSDKNGVLVSLPDEEIIPAGTPFTSYGKPLVGMSYNENYKVSTGVVSFIKTMDFRATNGNSYRVQDEVYIYFVPLEGDEWYIADMWHGIGNVEKVR